MPPSSEAVVTVVGSNPEARVARTAELAAAGYAARVATPGRLHAVNGRLHALAMLAELVDRHATGADDADALVLRRRIASVAREVDALERELRLLQSLVAFPVTARFARCDAAPVLREAQALLESESVRLGARLRMHVTIEPVWVGTSSDALLQAVVLCATAMLACAPQGAAATLVARNTGAGLVIEIAAPPSSLDDPLEADLLAEIVRAAGGRFDAGPPATIAFAHAPGPHARVDA